MNKLHRWTLAVKSIAKNRLIIILVLAFAMLLPGLFPARSVRAALSEVDRKRQDHTIMSLSTSKSTKTKVWKNPALEDKTSILTPKIYRTAFQIGGGNSFPCNGQCARQTLTCYGGTLTVLAGGCCISCCNSAGQCIHDCCTPSKGPGGIEE